MDSGTNLAQISSNLEPRDDMEFDTHEASYEYYKEYAKSVGFGTAKLSSRRSRASKEFIDAKFSCIRYGNKQQSDEAINPRPSPKIGCKASMHVKRKSNEKWYIHSFVREHNHELLPAQAHFFRSHRNSDSCNNLDSRVRKKKALASISKQYNGYQFSGTSLENVIRNQHDRGRYLSLEEGGAQAIIDFCSHMHEENSNFFYAFDFNEEHRLRNVLWVDAKGVEDFSYFNDVVSFDTTYFASKYKIPLVLFIGVNNHIQPTLLGCGLIADETLYTFIWLFKTWRLAMGGKWPKVMLTDQNESLKAAIQMVFPEIRHFFHVWNVLEKVPRRLDYLSIWHDTFMEKLNKCIRSCGEERFEKKWWKLLEKFNLRDDEWVQSLYEDRKLWVPGFAKEVSFAGLSENSRTESLNSFFDRYIHAETSIIDFLKNYKSVLEDIYEEEAKANFDTWHETPDLKSPSPFEKQMLLVYTHEIFKKFQVEVLGAAACHLKKEKEEDSNVIYSVKDFENNQDFTVEWDEVKSDIYCSCRSFEFKGYLCRHAIVVLQMSGVFSLPYKYVLQRWTNCATSRVPLSEKFDEVQAKVRRYNDLCRRAIILGEEGSLSQESYGIALGAIQESLKQCAGLSNPPESDLTRANLGVQSGEVRNLDGIGGIRGEQGPKGRVVISNKGSKRVNYGKEQVRGDGNLNKNGKQVPLEPQIVNAGAQSSFQHMDIPGGLDYSTLYPRFLTTLLKGGEMSKRSVEMLGEMLEEQN